MADAVDVAVADDIQDLADIDLRRGQQDLAQPAAAEFRHFLFQGQAGIGDDLADQAEAVGMHAAGRDADQHVPGLHLRPVNQFGFLHDAGGESGDVVFAVRVHARHFRRLAADQRAACLAAAFRHAGHDGFHLGGNVVADGDIIQEDQRLRALGQDVIDAHGHGIDADRVMLVHGESQLQFGSHAVRPADEHRLADTQAGEVEHAPEGADSAHRAFSGRGGDMLFDPADYFIARFQVDTCFFVRNCHIFDYSSFSMVPLYREVG